MQNGAKCRDSNCFKTFSFESLYKKTGTDQYSDIGLEIKSICKWYLFIEIYWFMMSVWVNDIDVGVNIGIYHIEWSKWELKIESR